LSNKNNERNTREQIKRIRIIMVLVILIIIFAQVYFGATGDSEFDDQGTGYGTEAVEPEKVTEPEKEPEKEPEAEVDTEPESGTESEPALAYVEYTFRNRDTKMSHYEKHGIEMGFASADEYEAAASAVVNNPAALHKLETEDNDDVYYIEETNEFVVVSTAGYIRTYFNPDRGKAYFDAQ